MRRQSEDTFSAVPFATIFGEFRAMRRMPIEATEGEKETDRHKDEMRDNQPNTWNTHNQIQLSMN